MTKKVVEEINSIKAFKKLEAAASRLLKHSTYAPSELHPDSFYVLGSDMDALAEALEKIV